MLLDFASANIDWVVLIFVVFLFWLVVRHNVNVMLMTMTTMLLVVFPYEMKAK